MRRLALGLGLGGIVAGAGLVGAGWQAPEAPAAPLPSATFDLGASEGARPGQSSGGSEQALVRQAAAADTSQATPWPTPGPDRVVLPSLRIDAPVSPVSLDANGSLVVPGDVSRVGRWRGAAPATASAGTTLLAGHVDSNGRLGALHPLAQVQPGARVVTTDGAGRATRWRVVSLTVRDKDHVPAFPTTGPRRLVLVTCGGDVVDTARGRSYVSNVLATAVPAAS